MNYLVNLVIPKQGQSISVKAYKMALAALGYNRWQQIGSIGGCIASGSLRYVNGMLKRG